MVSCCKTSSETLLSGAWATPGMLPSARPATQTRGRTRRPGVTKCSSTVGRSSECRARIAANLNDCKQLRIVGQGDAYSALVA